MPRVPHKVAIVVELEFPREFFQRWISDLIVKYIKYRPKTYSSVVLETESRNPLPIELEIFIILHDFHL